MVTSAGEHKNVPCFEQDSDTEVYDSCSIVWQSRLYLFGGFWEDEQISRLDGYKLKRIGTLAFELENAACTVMNNKYIFLCFGENEERLCRRSTKPTEGFNKIALSRYEHGWTSISASSSKFIFHNLLCTVETNENLAIVLAARGRDVEIFNNIAGTWTSIAAYPYVTE